MPPATLHSGPPHVYLMPRPSSRRAAIFADCGDVRRVRLLEPKDDTLAGFVDFGNLTAAAAARAKDGQDFDGRPLSVCYSRKTSPGGSGRRSQEARARRRKEREEQRASSSTTQVLNL
jgi:hypothetical protein